jgi:CDP-diacylglycerol--serine O-phosphatidyltransferase
MMALARRKRRRPDVRRAVILFPSGLTLGNLFFGVFAIVAASRLEFVAAGVYVLLGGICDALDGRVARATNAGTEFGEELDSLVDAITFGLAPGMIMYFAVLNRNGWDWVWAFVFAACAVLRLARFNIEQAGTAKTYFQGLPSPAAGITLASYYWFSQSPLYTYGAIADLPWQHLLRYLMAMLSFLMISNVPYPVFPRTGFRSLRAIGASLLVIGSLVLLATRRLEYFFPFALVYVAWGLLRWVLSGLFERRQPTIPYDLSEGEDDQDEDDEELDSEVHATRWSHRGDRAARLERAERPERSEKVERGKQQARPERAERPDRGERPERKDRGERPERAERARDGERSKREGRQKERGRRTERPPREARPDQPVPPASGVDAITLGKPDDAAAAPPSVAPVVLPPGEAASEAALPVEDSTAPRKRKRRRRRGERRDRSPSEATSPDDAIGSSDAGEAIDSSTDSSDAPDSAPRPASARPAEGAPAAPGESVLLLPRPSDEPNE